MPVTLAPVDWVFVAVALVSLAIGAWRGLVYEVLALLGWIAAFVLAQWFAPQASAWLPLPEVGPALRYAAGFVLVFIAAVFATSLLASVTSKLMAVVGLRPVDRMLGALFGLLRGGILLLVAVLVVGMTPWKNSPQWQAGRGVAIASEVLASVRPLLPAAAHPYLPL